MEHQNDFRSLIYQILSSLSGEQICGFFFVLGDTIPRIKRENTTLSGSLEAIEILFDGAKISVDDCGYLIDAFNKIECYAAAKRLEEFQKPKRQPTTNQFQITAILADNTEDDKYAVPHERFILECEKLKSDPKETKQSPYKTEAIVTANGSQKKRKTHPHLLIYSCYVLLILQILFSILYILWISKKNSSVTSIVHRQEVYFLKYGSYPVDLYGNWFNHSVNLTLTFEDRLLYMNVSQYENEIDSIEFFYSRNKHIKHRLQRSINSIHFDSLLFNFTNHTLKQIKHCYRYGNNSRQILGLEFDLGNNRHQFFGNCAGDLNIIDHFPEPSFGYISTKISDAGYLQGFRFIWYQICSLNRTISSCR